MARLKDLAVGSKDAFLKNFMSICSFLTAIFIGICAIMQFANASITMAWVDVAICGFNIFAGIINWNSKNR